MIPKWHLLARTKRDSNATQMTPPPMSSWVKSACPVVAEVTSEVTEITAAPSAGGTLQHSCSSHMPSEHSWSSSDEPRTVLVLSGHWLVPLESPPSRQPELQHDSWQ